MTAVVDRPPALASIPRPVARTGRSQVFVVDAVPLASLGLRVLFDRSPGLSWCGSSTGIAAALSAVERLRPDIVLIDSALDRDSTAVRAMRAAHAGVKVIGMVRGGNGARSYVRQAMDSGVRGLIPRAASPADAIAAIHVVRNGGTLFERGLSALAAEERSPQSGVLSERQLAVLELISAGNNNGAIAERLFLSVETIRSHVKAILVRLQARDRAHAVARGYELGLLGRDPRSGMTA